MNYQKNTAIGLSVLLVIFISFIYFYHLYDLTKDIATYIYIYFFVSLLTMFVIFVFFLQTIHAKHTLEKKVDELTAKLTETGNKTHALYEEIEQRVQKRTELLEQKNQELELFSYAISHDLHAPIRAIDGFAQILIEDYYDQFDDKGKDSVKRICKGSKKLLHIIDEMLKLAHINKKDIYIQDVNLSTIAQEYIDLIIETTSKSKVKFIIAPDLTARGDYGLLDAAIGNILNNAVKYTSKKENPIIEFNINHKKIDENSTDLHKRVFYMKDNGVGFDMKHSDTIFDIFKRLHKSDDFDGTGIGLTTVKRVIDRHGGKIWVESQRDIGTTVYFTLG